MLQTKHKKELRMILVNSQLPHIALYHEMYLEYVS